MGQPMSTDDWVELVCRELGVSLPDTDLVLDLARDVAHGVERKAAPVTTLLVGLAATSGDDLPAVVARVRALLET